jgi:signal transduction histidine kinase
MLFHPELVQICELTIRQIREVLAVHHVSIQRYLPATGEWQSQLPTAAEPPPSSFLSLIDGLDGEEPMEMSGELTAIMGQRLRDLEVVSFKIISKIGSVAVKGECLLLPITCQNLIWGRICIISNSNIWQLRDFDWLQVLAKVLGQSIFAIYQLQVPQAMHDAPAAEQLHEQLPTFNHDSVEILHAQLTELVQRDQLKDEFISKISHDLRAPLMNMRMALKMLKISVDRDPNLSPLLMNKPIQGYWNILEAECEREISLVNNVLDLQRIETGNAQLQMNELDLGTWLVSIAEPYQSRAAHHQQKLQLRLPEQPTPLVTDEGYLQRIIAELLHNACKYTAIGQEIICELEYPPPLPRLSRLDPIALEEQAATRLAVNTVPIYLTISNQAIVAATDLPHLFDKFYRVPAADHRRQGGTGLGLSLVRDLVEQLHGQITVQSRDGWTIFTVALPLAPPNEINSYN